MHKKAVLVGLVCMTAVTIGLYVWNNNSRANTPNAGQRPAAGVISVEADTITPTTARRVVRAIGTVRAQEAITLRPEDDGRITKIAFDSGQFVRKGQILLVLDGTVLEAELTAARAAADYAEAQFRRAETLMKNGTATLRTLEEATSQRDMNRARRALAQTKLDQATIRAPFNGYVGLRRISVGDYVQKGDMLGTLDQLDPVRIEWAIAEKYLPLLRVGMNVDLDGLNRSATITAVSPRIDPTSRLGQIEATLSNPDQQLKPGQFVQVKIALEAKDQAIMIPEQALVPQGNQHVVWTIDAQNQAQKMIVTPGARIGQKIEIMSGLHAGTKIITAGQQKLRPGQQVNPVAPTNIDKTPDAEEVEYTY